MRKKPVDVILVVDKSGSLSPYTETLNSAIKQTVVALKTSEDLSGCDVYFTLVSFDNNMYKNIDFDNLNSVDASTLELKYEGGTNPAPALEYALQKSIKRYETYKANGEPAYHPLIFFFTDGSPYPENPYLDEFKRIAAEYKDYEANNKLVIVSCGFGDKVNIDNLKLLTYDSNRVISVNKNDIEKLKKFFSKLIEATASTATGERPDMARFFANYNFNE